MEVTTMPTISTNRKVQLGTLNRVVTNGIGLTLTLPSASWTLAVRSLPTTVLLADAGGPVVIQPQPGETIDGDTSYTLSNAFQFVTMMAAGGTWNVVGNN
jgi:hypothetical protein